MILDLYRSARVVVALWWKSLGIRAETLDLTENTGGIHWRSLQKCDGIWIYSDIQTLIYYE